MSVNLSACARARARGSLCFGFCSDSSCGAFTGLQRSWTFIVPTSPNNPPRARAARIARSDARVTALRNCFKYSRRQRCGVFFSFVFFLVSFFISTCASSRFGLSHYHDNGGGTLRRINPQRGKKVRYVHPPTPPTTSITRPLLHTRPPSCTRTHARARTNHMQMRCASFNCHREEPHRGSLQRIQTQIGDTPAPVPCSAAVVSRLLTYI